MVGRKQRAYPENCSKFLQAEMKNFAKWLNIRVEGVQKPDFAGAGPNGDDFSFY